MILLGSLLALSGCGIFQANPKPCDCGQAEKELRAYTLKYFDVVEDTGNLWQQLKACQERK